MKLKIHDVACRNGLPLLKVSIRWQMLLVDGADFYANCKGWKKCQKEKPCRNCPFTLRQHNDTNPCRGKKISRYPADEELRILIWYIPLVEANHAI